MEEGSCVSENWGIEFLVTGHYILKVYTDLREIWASSRKIFSKCVLIYRNLLRKLLNWKSLLANHLLARTLFSVQLVFVHWLDWMDFCSAYGSSVLGRAVFNASGCVAYVPSALSGHGPLWQQWFWVFINILFGWSIKQEKKLLTRTCHAVLVTRTAVKDLRALTCEDNALSKFGLTDSGRSFAAINQCKSLFLFNFHHVSAGPVPKFFCSGKFSLFLGSGCLEERGWRAFFLWTETGVEITPAVVSMPTVSLLDAMFRGVCSQWGYTAWASGLSVKITLAQTSN